MGNQADYGCSMTKLGHLDDLQHNYQEGVGPGLQFVAGGEETEPVFVPTRVEMLRGTRIVEIAANASNTICRAANGALVVFGDDEELMNDWARDSPDGLLVERWPERRRRVP